MIPLHVCFLTWKPFYQIQHTLQGVFVIQNPAQPVRSNRALVHLKGSFATPAGGFKGQKNPQGGHEEKLERTKCGAAQIPVSSVNIRLSASS
jgi:hypothetical protein